MINKNNTCLIEDCSIYPCFNFKGEKIPIYNFKSKKTAIFCIKHKKVGMIDIKHNMCNNDWCNTLCQKKYRNYCFNCFIHMFPEEKVSRNYKTKEYSVFEYIKENFKDKNWINDKKIYEGCSKKRPDILLDLGYNILIIEIDENQHTTYENICENKGLMEISQDLGHRPIIFIRFNPDSYIDVNGVKIKSCWGLDGYGLCSIKNKNNWNERLIKLKEKVEYWMDEKNKSNKTIKIENLFYDENFK